MCRAVVVKPRFGNAEDVEPRSGQANQPSGASWLVSALITAWPTRAEAWTVGFSWLTLHLTFSTCKSWHEPTRRKARLSRRRAPSSFPYPSCPAHDTPPDSPTEQRLNIFQSWLVLCSSRVAPGRGLPARTRTAVYGSEVEEERGARQATREWPCGPRQENHKAEEHPAAQWPRQREAQRALAAAAQPCRHDRDDAARQRSRSSPGVERPRQPHGRCCVGRIRAPHARWVGCLARQHPRGLPLVRQWQRRRAL